MLDPVDEIINTDFDLGIGLADNLSDNLSDFSTPLEFSDDTFASDLDFLSSSFPSEPSCDYSMARTILLNRLHIHKEGLCMLGNHLHARLMDGSAAIELPSIDDDSPIPMSFHFTNWRVTVAYNCYWSLVILTNKLIMKLLPVYDPRSYALEAECRSFAFEICKTWEDAWANKPIGAFHTGLSFVMAYEYCSPDVQEWILKGLNALLDQQLVDSFRWSDEVIRMMSGKLAGEGSGLSFSGCAKASN